MGKKDVQSRIQYEIDGQIGKEGAARDEEQNQAYQKGVDGCCIDSLHAGDEQVLIGNKGGKSRKKPENKESSKTGIR